MKNLISRYILTGAGMGVLVATVVCLSPVTNAQTTSTAPPPPDANPSPVAVESPAMKTPPVTTPPAIFPTSPLAQVVRLAQAGVAPDVILTFITNSSSTFNLDADKIIYASDAGVPGTMVTAMMQRDQFLQEQFAAGQAAQQAQPIQPAQPAPAPEPVPAAPADSVAPPDTQPVSVNYFYDTLMPYGGWVVVTGYGRCWRPTVCVYDSSWQPYCDRGRWVYTDCGWYWNSDYAWGATFHYGRWFRTPNYGWCWYPGTVWAPSWVTWRYSNNYCGWAPLPPGTGWQAGVGIVYNGGGVSVGFGFGLGANCFTFVPTQYFCNYYPRSYCVPPAQVAQVYNNTTVINNYSVNNHAIVNQGIGVDSIAASSHRPIRPVPVHDINAATARNGYPYDPRVQPINAPGANRPANPGNSNPSERGDLTTHNHYPATGQNWNASPAPSPQHNIVVATIPQRQMPVANYNLPPFTPAQPPATVYHPSQPPAPTEWNPGRPAGTPRNVTLYDHGARQYRSAPAVVAAPQHSAPQHSSQGSAPSGNQPSQGGSHGGFAGGPSH